MSDQLSRNDPLFGGVAWHGHDEGSAAEQTVVHDQYPSIGTFDTEHSGGTWIANQQNEDMDNIIDYTRDWGAWLSTRTWVRTTAAAVPAPD